MADSQAVLHTGMATNSTAPTAEPIAAPTPGDLLSAALNVTPGQKRVFAQVGEERPKRKKNKKAKLHQGPVVQKNALMQLNEIKPGLVYNVVAQEGPVHNPVFRVQVEVNGQVFEGEAISKKKAKLAVAEKALKSFIQVPDASATVPQNTGENSGDFTTDQGEGSGFSAFDGNKTAKTNGAPTPAVKKELSLAGIPMSKPVQPQGKNPVMILNEIRPGTQYECIAESGDHILKNFTMQINLDGKEFVGEGRNKKQAKARAAQAALKELYNLEFQNPPEDDGIPYFVGPDDAWTKFKTQVLTLKTGQQIQYDGKNPIQKLNELYKDIVYRCIDPEGPFKAANLFRVIVQVEGQEYEGMANSKKTAKLSAASAALESLAVTGILTLRESQLNDQRRERDDKQRQMMQRLREAQVARGSGPLWPKRKPVEERGFPGPINPCTRLNERFKSAQYKIVGQLGEYPNTQFTVQCVVQGVSYLGAGRSKKIAKYNAAEKAMRARNIWTEQDESLKQQRVMEDGKTYKNPPEPRVRRGGRGGGNRGYMAGQGMGRGGRGGGAMAGGRGRGAMMGGARGGMGANRGGGAMAGYRGAGGGNRGAGNFRGARGGGASRGGASGAGGGYGAQGNYGGAGDNGTETVFNSGFKFNQGQQKGGFKFGGQNQGGGGGGGKPFKSVLSQQWTNFRKGGELGSGGVTFNQPAPPPPPQNPLRQSQPAPPVVSTGYTGGYNTGSGGYTPGVEQVEQYTTEHQYSTGTDFTSDNYSYDDSNQQQQVDQYNYGYSMDTTQQQNFNYAASAYTTGYQNPNYGYGYSGYGTDMYAQGHSY